MNLLTIRQAAAQINVCRNTLRAMIDDGRVRAKNIARPGAKKPSWRVVAQSLQEFRIEPLGAEVLEEKLREAELQRRIGW
jgi:excisionase family DNA binding protein